MTADLGRPKLSQSVYNNPQETIESYSCMRPPFSSSFHCTHPTRTFTTERGETVPGLNIEAYIPVGCLRLHRTDTSLSPEVWTSHYLWSSFSQSDNPSDRGNEVSLSKDVQDALSVGLKRYGYSPLRRDPCKHRWARMEFKMNTRDLNYGQVRVFVLPDDIGRTHIKRSDSDLRKQLISMLENLDISPDTFRGAWDPEIPVQYIDLSRRSDQIEEVTKELSLLHIFNHLPSPNPQPKLVKDKRFSEAMLDLLENNVRGLKADLFSFQSRTAAMMLQREVQPKQHLDPRLNATKDQAGANFYYNKITGEWLRHPRLIDGPRGGILAEHMGRGKTLICLALIMATRHHYPSFPVDHCESLIPVRQKVGSLMEMAAAATARSSIPWKTCFQEILEDRGEDYERCQEMVRSQASHYTIVPPASRRQSSRRGIEALPSRKIFRASTTIVVVPPNLVDQWTCEVEKHTTGLKVLVMKQTKMKLPAAQMLIEYDIILFSKLRLEKEFPNGVNLWSTTKTGHRRGCTCGCDCFSPLLEVHFKRLITDEGHFIGNSGGRSASKLVQIMNILAVDYRWVVSGTPTQGIYGIENSEKLNFRYDDTENNHKQQRRDVEKIGNIATSFLKAEPWASDTGSWARFNMQARYGEPEYFSYGDPDCLKQIMENIVLRTRAEDVEAEISLPELHEKLVYLDASVQDAIQLNVFVLSIIVNAVTSERKDADYFFHPKNRGLLNELTRNLSQASFFWSGWAVENVLSTVAITNEFLTERKIFITDEDEAVLREALAVGQTILKFICSYPEQRHRLTTPLDEKNISSGPDSIFEAAWATDEIPIFVSNDLPEDVRMAWALDRSVSSPTLFGFTQLKTLSDFAISQLWKPDSLDGLCEAGMKAMENCREPGAAKLAVFNASMSKEKELLPKKNISGTKASQSSGKSLSKESKRSRPDDSKSISSPLLASGASVGGHMSPRKPRRHVLKESNGNTVSEPIGLRDTPPRSSFEKRDQPKLKSAMKKSAPAAQKPTMDPGSKLVSAHLESTASAKLTYIIAQILAVKDEEKSIIFYEAEDIGYYLAQALEAIGVEYLIYATAKTLSSALQSRWLRKFADEDNIRVLLMDLGAGTFGLDVSCASRVFFVNPVFNPQIEAQAIKRAHRIGQTRPVYVEILVMRGSMEEKIVERRKQLSDGDFRGIKTVLDDEEMYEWVKNPSFLPLPDPGDGGLSNIPKTETMAKLPVPHQIFGSLLKRSDDIEATSFQENPAPETKLKAMVNADDAKSLPKKKMKKTVGFGPSENEEPDPYASNRL